MRNILLIGLGRFGRTCAAQLNEMQQSVMAVDKDEERVNKVLPFVTSAQIGDSTDVSFLRSLGINNYDVCIVAIGDDFISSLETASLLRELGAKYVIARAASLTQEKFLLRNGADEVVFPEKQLGKWTAIRCSSESMSNYIELDSGYSIFEIRVPKDWEERSIGMLDIRHHYDINILGIRETKNAPINMHVTVDTVLKPDQYLLVLADQNEVKKICRI